MRSLGRSALFTKQLFIFLLELLQNLIWELDYINEIQCVLKFYQNAQFANVNLIFRDEGNVLPSLLMGKPKFISYLYANSVVLEKESIYRKNCYKPSSYIKYCIVSKDLNKERGSEEFCNICVPLQNAYSDCNNLKHSVIINNIQWISNKHWQNKSKAHEWRLHENALQLCVVKAPLKKVFILHLS